MNFDQLSTVPFDQIDFDPFTTKSEKKDHEVRTFKFTVPTMVGAPQGTPTIVQFYKAVGFCNRLAVYAIDDRGKTYKIPVLYYNKVYVEINNKTEFVSIINSLAEHIVRANIVNRDLMQCYSPTTSMFAEIYINCPVRTFHTKMGRDHGSMLIHEESIPIDTKFFTEYNLEYSGTYEIYDIEKYDLIGRDHVKEYQICWYEPTHIIKHSKPKQIKPRIGYFDIETASTEYFPHEYLIQDVINIISFIIDEPDGTSHKYCYTTAPSSFAMSNLDENFKLKDGINLNRPKTTRNVSPPSDGRDFTTYSFTTEKEMLEQFLKDVGTSGINVITGYNILKFDIKYIFFRCIMQGIDIGKKIVYKKSNDEYMFNYPSLVCIDLFKFVKSHVPLTELSSYKLKDVCKFYKLEDGKIEMAYQFMFDNYKSILQKPTEPKHHEDFGRVIEYCVRDSEVLSALYEKLQIWMTFTAFSNIHYAGIEIIANEGSVRKLTNLIYRWMAYCGYVFVPNTGDKIKYEGGFVHLSSPGYKENVAIVDFASLYPSLIISNNLCPTTLIHPQDVVPPDAVAHKIDYKVVQEDQTEDMDIYEDEGEYDDDDDEAPPPKKKTGIFADASKTKMVIVERTVNVVPVEKRHGVFPQILTFLLSQRKVVKKKMEKHEEDYVEAKRANKEAQDAGRPVPFDEEQMNELSFLFLEHEKMQLALKITANSLYGICCARGAIACMEVGIITTMLGRTAIKNVNAHLAQCGYEHVYSDTDSSMVTIGDCSEPSTREKILKLFPNTTEHHLEKLLRLPYKLHLFQKVVDEMNASHAYYTDPMKLEFETFADVGVWLKKKFYVCYIKSELKYKTRGTVDRRSDKPEILKRLFRNLYRQILDNHDVKQSVKLVVDCISSMSTLPFEDYEISKGYRGIDKYANPETAPMVKFVLNAERSGVKIDAGSRVRYVMANECYAKDTSTRKDYIEELRKARTKPAIAKLLARPGHDDVKKEFVAWKPEYSTMMVPTTVSIRPDCAAYSSHDSDYWATKEMGPTVNYQKYRKFMSQQINTMLTTAYPDLTKAFYHCPTGTVFVIGASTSERAAACKDHKTDYLCPQCNCRTCCLLCGVCNNCRCDDIVSCHNPKTIRQQDCYRVIDLLVKTSRD